MSPFTNDDSPISPSIERSYTLPLNIRSKTPVLRPRRLSRELPNLPQQASQAIAAAKHGLTEGLERVRAAGNSLSLARPKTAPSDSHGQNGPFAGREYKPGKGKFHYTRAGSTAAHPALLHQQRSLTCGLCEGHISPSTPSICTLKCHKCSSALCAECFDVLSTVVEDVEDSDSDYDDVEDPHGVVLHMELKARKRLARESKDLKMAQCADCLRCWCASCSKGDPWRYFQTVVTEVRDDSSEMTSALNNDGLFVKSKRICPTCYEANMVEEKPEHWL